MRLRTRWWRRPSPGDRPAHVVTSAPEGEVTVRAAIHYFHSPDLDDLATFRPTSRETAGALIEMMMSPEDEYGEESFQIVVGTREYLASIRHQKYAMVVDEWDFPTIEAELRRRVAAVEGATWTEVGEQINVWAQWELDNYRPAKP